MATVDQKPINGSGLLYLIQKIKSYFVAKETGKGLSTNDFTNELKTKLDGIEAQANKYTLPVAANGTRGGIQIGYTQSGKNYPVQLSSEKAFVNVPWENTTYSDANASSSGLMSASDYSKLSAFQTADKYALKTDISRVIRFKGSVDTYNDLPASPEDGDMYDVKSNGHNYIWLADESRWDDAGGTFAIEYLTNTEIDTIWAQGIA